MTVNLEFKILVFLIFEIRFHEDNRYILVFETCIKKFGLILYNTICVDTIYV